MPLVKSAYQKYNFIVSQPKHMLWVLKRTVSMKRFLWAPKTYVKTDGKDNIYNFMLKILFIWTYGSVDSAHLHKIYTKAFTDHIKVWTLFPPVTAFFICSFHLFMILGNLLWAVWSGFIVFASIINQIWSELDYMQQM